MVKIFLFFSLLRFLKATISLSELPNKPLNKMMKCTNQSLPKNKVLIISFVFSKKNCS